MTSCGWPCGAGSAERARVSLVVATVIGRATLDVPVRSKLIVPAARLQAIANKVPCGLPNRAMPG